MRDVHQVPQEPRAAHASIEAPSRHRSVRGGGGVSVSTNPGPPPRGVRGPEHEHTFSVASEVDRPPSGCRSSSGSLPPAGAFLISAVIREAIPALSTSRQALEASTGFGAFVRVSSDGSVVRVEDDIGWLRQDSMRLRNRSGPPFLSRSKERSHITKIDSARGDAGRPALGPTADPHGPNRVDQLGRIVGLNEARVEVPYVIRAPKIVAAWLLEHPRLDLNQSLRRLAGASHAPPHLSSPA